MKRDEITRCRKINDQPILVPDVIVGGTGGAYIFVDRYEDPSTGMAFDLMQKYDFYRVAPASADPYEVVSFGPFQKLDGSSTPTDGVQEDR